jgi:hypothetical protein
MSKWGFTKPLTADFDIDEEAEKMDEIARLTAELEAANKKLEMARAFIERMADGDFAWIGDASVTARQALAAIQAEGGK